VSTEPKFSMLEDRAILAVSGKDRVSFLQGLVSNDVEKAGPKQAIYAALLTPQGKYLHDFFIVGFGGEDQEPVLLLDCEKARLQDLIQRLTIYKLRADVTLEDRSDELAVAALYGEGWNAWARKSGLPEDLGSAAAFGEEGVVYIDPRLAGIGGRAIVLGNGAEMTFESADFIRADAADYDLLRLRLGLPDGSRDLVVDKAILLESGFDELGGVDWDKGCYMGQELTARTKYRGLAKKRLMPVAFDAPPPPPSTPIMRGEKEVGQLRSSIATEDGGIGLALIRLEALDEAGAKLMVDGINVTVVKPDWMTIEA